MSAQRTAPTRATLAAVLALATGVAVVAPATAASAAPVLEPTLLSVSDAAAVGDAAAAVRASGGQVLATYDIAGALLATLPAGAPAGTVVVPDTSFTFTAAPVTAVEGPAATYRATIGDDDRVDGAGVTVALVDTGVADVPDLSGRVEHVNVSGDVAGDGLGHGTFLAGLIAGSGAQSEGTYAGVAPAARVLDVQVAAADGSTSMARVLAGLQAVADRAAVDPTLDVVSLSLTTGSPLPPNVDPLGRALGTLWRRGLTVVVAAGNDGPDAQSVSSPGSDPLLLTIGTLDEARTAQRSDDAVADFSSRGTRFGVTKPDLVAPGVSLVSLRAPGSLADVANPQSVVADSYFTGTGTSMSTAVTAGAVAALLSARPGLAPGAVKGLLRRSAYPVAGTGAGAGGLDLAAAWTAPLSSTPPAWPGSAGGFGPSESDAATWAAFAAAWVAGDLAAARAAWAELTAQSRRWAASAWAVAVVAAAAGLPADEWASRRWASRRWAVDEWSSRRWADESWVSRRWASDAWESRRWAFEDWASRRWADVDWTSRRWADVDWTSRRWAEEDWLGFAWTSRRWATQDWAAVAWDSRRWSSRRWAADDWATFTFESRRWATEVWTSRRWAVQAW